MSKTKFLRKRQLLKLVDRLPGTIFQYREWPDGRCAFPYSTRAIEEIFFTTPKKLSKDGNLAWNCLTEESAKEVRDALKQSEEKLEEFSITFCTRSPQDRLHWIQMRALPERLKDGGVLWHGHMKNITAQHHAEEAAKQKTALLNVIFENLPDHIYYKDREARMLGLNPACSKYHHRTSEEMIGKTDLDFYPP